MSDTYTVIGFTGEKEVILSKDVSFQDAIEVSVDNDHLYDKITISEDYELLYKAENLLVVSDCHMLLKETKELLIRPEKLNEQFIFLGNFISHGEGFYEFMTYLSSIKAEKGRYCVFVKGVNEYNLMQYIHGTEDYIGHLGLIHTMIADIEKSLSFSLRSLEEKFPDFYNILNDALPFYENDQYVMVSGGLDLRTPQWRDSGAEHLHITQTEFLQARNITGKTIVFGQITVQELNHASIVRPWINDMSKKIGINGDCRNMGKLFGLVIHGEERCFLGIRHHKARKISYAY